MCSAEGGFELAIWKDLGNQQCFPPACKKLVQDKKKLGGSQPRAGEEQTTGCCRGACGAHREAASCTLVGKGPGRDDRQPGSLMNPRTSLQSTRRLIKHRPEVLEEALFLISLSQLQNPGLFI